MGIFGAFFGCRGDVGFKGPLLGESRGDAGFKASLLGVSRGVVGFNVATLSRLVREKVRPAWPDVCVSVKMFALRAQNGPKSAFSGPRGEFFRGRVAGGAVLGEFFRANRPCAGLGCSAAHFRLAEVGGGVCSIRSWLAACRRRVVPLMTPFPRCVVLRLRREGVDASIVLFSAVGEADARRIW